jgi:hypothetical protein
VNLVTEPPPRRYPLVDLLDALTGVIPHGKETAPARAGWGRKVGAFEKCRRKEAGTILLWVPNPPIPIKFCFKKPKETAPALGGS